eukprot:559866-Rhodomonas_salina.3
MALPDLINLLYDAFDKIALEEEASRYQLRSFPTKTPLYAYETPLPAYAIPSTDAVVPEYWTTLRRWGMVLGEGCTEKECGTGLCVGHSYGCTEKGMVLGYEDHRHSKQDDG